MNYVNATINDRKTKYMDNGSDDLCTGGNCIRKLDQFCYLESVIELNETSNLDVKKIICAARKNIKC